MSLNFTHVIERDFLEENRISNEINVKKNILFICFSLFVLL